MAEFLQEHPAGKRGVRIRATTFANVGWSNNNIKNNQKGKETNVAGGKRPLIERSDLSGENVFSVEKPAEDAEPLEAEKFQVAIAEL